MSDLDHNSAITAAAKMVSARIQGDEVLVEAIREETHPYELEAGLTGIACATIIQLASAQGFPEEDLTAAAVMFMDQIIMEMTLEGME